MNIKALLERTSLVIQDGSFTHAIVLPFINEGLRVVAGEVPLQALEKEDIITTVADEGETSLPSDYQNHLRYAYSNTGRRRLRIYSNLVRLREMTPTNTGGFIARCAVSGTRTLHYTPVPSTEEELSIIYHSMPEPYESLTSEDEEDIIPAHIGPRILLAYACKEIWNLIEDGTEGQQVNTAKWENKYEMALEDLRTFVGPLYTRPNIEMLPVDMTGL
jgi:hypothetical protein